MLKENDYIFSKVSMVIDLFVSALAVVVAHLLRNYIIAPYLAPDLFRFRSRLADYWWLLIVLPVLTVLLLRYNGYYRSQRIRSLATAVGAILFASSGASLMAIVISFVFTPRGDQSSFFSQVFSGEFVSRGILLLFPLLAALFLSLKTVAVRGFLIRLRNRGYNTRNVLLVGSLQEAESFLDHLNRHPYWGFKVAGLITATDSATVEDSSSLPIVGNYETLFSYLEQNVVDDVVFVAGNEGLDSLAPMLRGCEEMGIRTRLPVAVFQNRIAKPVLDQFDELPVITFNPVREVGPAVLFKYAFDRIAAALLLVILFPLMLLIGCLIKLTSARFLDPVFYGQPRCGLNGRLFTLWKFRSMNMNSEDDRKKLESLNEMSGPVFKIRNDPRITPIGKWLRKFSLDELPQLWNVLKGEMSLVGPRPPLPDEVAKYDRWQRRRLSMKPGITCIWQVSGRNNLSFDTWMKLDLEYIDRWSLWLDFKILCKTVYVVATGHGAM